jgi:hypothetical protein
MVFDLLTVEQGVVVLEVVTGLGKRRRAVGSGFSVVQARQFGEGELKRGCQNVGWLVSKQIGWRW